MQAAQCLLTAVQELQHAAHQGDNAVDEAVAHGLQQIEQLDELHRTCIDGLTNTRPQQLIPVIFAIVGVDPNEPITTVIAALEALHNAIQTYHYHFLCHRRVRLCRLPCTVPSEMRIEEMDEPEKDIYLQHAPKAAHAQQLSEFEMQQSIADRIGTVMKQIVLMWGMAQSAKALLDHTMPLGSEAFCLQLHLRSHQVTLESVDTKLDKIFAYISDYVYNHIMQVGYRKHQEFNDLGNVSATYIAKQQLTKNKHYPTGCFQKHMDIQRFLSVILTGNHVPDVIRSLMKGTKGEKIFSVMAKMLAMSMDPRFPLSVPNPMLYAFNNGIFNIRTMTFKPYVGDGDEMALDALRLDTTGMSNEEVAELKNYVQENLNGPLENASDDKVEEHIRGTNSQARMYIQEEFSVADLKASETPEGLKELEFPELAKILADQGLQHDVRVEVFGLHGRSLFPRNFALDVWMIAPYHVGCAGTGKSALIESTASFVPSDKVGTAEVNMQDKFGMEGLENKELIIATECPRSLQMELLCKAISGEKMSINRKNKTVVEVERWNSPWLFAGNKFFIRGNEAMQISRRIAIISHNTVVPKRDDGITQALKKNRAKILILLTRCYHNMCRTRGKEDFYLNAHPYFIAEMNKRYIMSNPLATFVNDAGWIVRTPPNTPPNKQYYMEWRQFVTAATDYARKSGTEISLASEDDYQVILQNHHLRIVAETRFDYIQQVDKPSKWLIGCALADSSNSNHLNAMREYLMNNGN